MRRIFIFLLIQLKDEYLIFNFNQKFNKILAFIILKLKFYKKCLAHCFFFLF
jgi:hypothetical protein